MEKVYRKPDCLQSVTGILNSIIGSTTNTEYSTDIDNKDKLTCPFIKDFECECIRRELDILKSKSMDADLLKLERDELQMKLNELSHQQVECESLFLKCKYLKGAAEERDAYKKKYEDILSIECECEIIQAQADAARDVARERDTLAEQVGILEACICKQEAEITALVMQVENLTRSKDETQSRIKDALATVRAEVEQKDNIIAASEEKLMAVEAQLKNSIQCMHCEAAVLKDRIKELETELEKSRLEIENLRRHNNDNNKDISSKGSKAWKNDKFKFDMKRELQAVQSKNKKLKYIASKVEALTDDRYVEMCKPPKCLFCTDCADEDLGNPYEECLCIENITNIEGYAGDCANEICYFECIKDSESNQTLREDLDEIRREKENLEKLVEQIQHDKLSCRSLQQLRYLRMDYAKLQEKLEKEVQYRRELENSLNK